MEKEKIGVQLGRFAPFHLGHNLITTEMAEDFRKESIILVASPNNINKRTPFTFPQRKQLIKKIHPKIKVIAFPDVATGTTTNYENTFQQWLENLKTLESSNNAEFVFYGGSKKDLDYLSKRFKTHAVGRNHLPISATKVREISASGETKNLKKMMPKEIIDLTMNYFQYQVAQLSKGEVLNPYHTEARFSKAESYPERFPVPDEKVFWEIAFPEYQPEFFDSEILKTADWAENENAYKTDNFRERFAPHIDFDEEGKPLNPEGRTGISGRGILGNWGVNKCIDDIITREKNRKYEILLIKRKDNGKWAFVGGFQDDGEEVETAMSRELEEEAGIKIDMKNAEPFYKGHVDSARNTDNAWIETEARHLHNPKNQILTAGDDALEAEWIPVDKINFAKIDKGHHKMMNLLLQKLK